MTDERSLRDELAGERSFLRTLRMTFHGLDLSEGSDDHFYGAWYGPRRSMGGHPGLEGTSNADLIKAMEAKYAGSDWSALANVDPALAAPVADEIDDELTRYGTEGWKFVGVRTPAHGGNVIAEVKHVEGTDGSAVFLPQDHWGPSGDMAALAKSQQAKPKWSVSSQTAGVENFARSVVSHEMGHEYMGLNLHLRIGPNREAPIRKAIEPWFHNVFLPAMGKAHISQYARKNPHEAWAELWAAANGYGHPQDEDGYVAALEKLLTQFAPPVGGSTAGLSEADFILPDSWLTTVDGMEGLPCGWSIRHPSY